MKSYLVTSILLLIVGDVYSQGIIVNSNKLWSVLHESSVVHIHPDDPYPFIKTTWYKISGDTIIEDKNYKHLLISNNSHRTHWKQQGAIREEGLKIYYFNNYDEILLYDFGLNVNDTIVLQRNGVYINYALDSVGIYPTEVSGLKTFHFSTFTDEDQEWKKEETWIEGIGSLNGLLRESCSFLIPCDHNYQLLCLYENDLLLYSNQDYNDCFIDSTIDSNTIPKAQKDIKIFPNPTKNEINIYTPSHTKIFSVELVNLKGHCLYKDCNVPLNNLRLNLNQFPEGYYILRIESSRGLDSWKIVIQ